MWGSLAEMIPWMWPKKVCQFYTSENLDTKNDDGTFQKNVSPSKNVPTLGVGPYQLPL